MQRKKIADERANAHQPFKNPAKSSKTKKIAKATRFVKPARLYCIIGPAWSSRVCVTRHDAQVHLRWVRSWAGKKLEAEIVVYVPEVPRA